MKPRTDTYLRAAVNACGRRVGDGEYELTWSKRRIARHLNVSYRTLAYHLDRADITSIDPLRVALTEAAEHRETSTSPATVAPHVATSSPSTDVLAVVQHAAHLACTVDDLDLRSELVATAAALLDAWLSSLEAAPATREVVREFDAEPRAVPREEPRAASRASQDSQSDSSSSLGTTKDCLTDLKTNNATRENQVRENDDLAQCTPRAPSAAIITEAEALEAIAPLVEQCRRLNLPAIDADGLAMLCHYRVVEIEAARRYVNSRLVTEKVRSPLGLLLHTLKKGTVLTAPGPTRTPPRPVTVPDEPTTKLPDVELSDDDVNDYFDTHLRPTQSPLMAAREPALSVKRALVADHLNTRTTA